MDKSRDGEVWCCYRVAMNRGKHAHGFTDATPAEDVALMHSELSELLEDIRDHRSLQDILYERKVELPPTIFESIVKFLSGFGAAR
jgi:hypothetical protein